MRKTLITLSTLGIFIGILLPFQLKAPKARAEVQISSPSKIAEIVTITDNTLFAVGSPTNPETPMRRKMEVIVTAYSSTPWETDDSPEITASGSRVREGIVANNFLPLGTKIKIPELFGDRVFVVEDRMHWKKGNYHIDIWLPSYQDAKNFGVKRTYILY